MKPNKSITELTNKINTSLENKIYKEVLESLQKKGINLTLETIEKVCRSQWEFLVYVMRIGESESLRMQYLGNWGIKTGREYFNSERYLNKEQMITFNSIESKIEKFEFLKKVYTNYIENVKEKKPFIQKSVKVFKNLKEIFNGTIEEASKLTKIPPIYILISSSKRTKTRNNYTFILNEEETISEN